MRVILTTDKERRELVETKRRILFMYVCNYLSEEIEPERQRVVMEGLIEITNELQEAMNARLKES